MLNKYRLKIVITVIILLILSLAWAVTRPVKIIRVSDTSVYVRNMPSSDLAKISWWNKNKNAIQQNYHVIKDAHNLEIFIMNFGGYTEVPTGSWDNNIDDYHCFDDIKSKKKCILNDISMVIRGDVDKNLYFTFDGKSYIQTPDGKVRLKKENSSIY